MIDRRGLLLAAAALPSAAMAAESDAALGGLLEQRLRARRSLGLVLGTTQGGRRRIVARGVRGRSDPRPVDGETVFGIASLSKPFTALLLSDAVLRGEVALEDPVARHLPAARLQEPNGRRITLLDLATHTSGLPHELPDASRLAASLRTRADAKARLYDHLAAWRPTSPPGAAWSYSNLEYTLIADALEARTGRTYAELVDQRIARPLGLTSTAVAPTRAMAARRASPHGLDLQPAPEWNKPWSPSPIQSTVGDLLTFVDACSGQARTPLARAAAAMLAVRRPAPPIRAEQALGWYVHPFAGRPLVAHSGAGGGFASTAVFDPATRDAVVLLSNAEDLNEDLARHVLRPSLPLDAIPVSVDLDAAALERLVGDYRDAAGGMTRIVRDARGLVLHMPAGYKAPLTPDGPTSFFVQGFAGLTASFETDAAGHGKRVTWTLSGKPTVAARVTP